MAIKKTKKKTILSRATPVAKLENAISALFYGRSGTGKTTISATFPTPLLLIDISEKGTDSIHDVEDVDVFQLTNFSELEEIYWELEDSKYNTVVIDAVHTLQDLAISKVKSDNSKVNEDQTSQKDFGLASGIMKSWILNYVDLTGKGINVVFLAHDRVTEIDGDGEDSIIPEVGPRLMPSCASTLTGSVNIVGHTYIKEKLIRPKKMGDPKKKIISYCLRVGPHGFYSTKIRKPKDQVLPDSIYDPSYDDLYQIVQGDFLVEQPKPATKSKKLKRK